MSNKYRGDCMKKVIFSIVASFVLGFSPLLWAKSAQEYYQNAVVHYKKQESKAAIIELKNALKEDVNHIASRLLLGNLYLSIGQPSYAEIELKRAKKLQAKPDDWLALLGMAYLHQGKSDVFLRNIHASAAKDDKVKSEIADLRGQALLIKNEIAAAQESFDQALVFDSKNINAKVGLAKIKAISGNYALAGKDVEAILAKAPNNILALELQLKIIFSQQKQDESLELIDRILKNQPFNRTAIMMHTAMMVEQKRFDAVKQDIQTIKQYYPRNPITYYFQSIILFQEDKLEDAKAVLQKMLSVVPSHTPSQLLMGKIAYKLKQFVVADEYLSKVVLTSPKNVEASMLLATVHIRNNQADKAIQTLEPFLADLKDNAQFLSLLGSAYHRAGKYDKGVEFLERVIELNPDFTGAQAQLALSQWEEGDKKNALKNLESATKTTGHSVQVDMFYIYALMQNKAFDEAEAAAKALLTTMPNNPSPYNLLGAVYVAENKLDEAIKIFEQSITIQPDFAASEFALGKIYVMKKHNDIAKKHFLRTLEINPSHTRALIAMAELEGKAGNIKEMEAYLLKASKIGESSLPGIMLARYYLTRDNTKALAHANALRQQFPKETEVLTILAKTQLAHGQVANAIRNLSLLLVKEPDSLTLNHLLAGAYGFNKEPKKALSKIDKVLSIKPGYLPALQHQVELLSVTAQFDAAHDVANTIIEKIPDRATGYQLKAGVYLKQKQPEQALVWFEKAYAKTQTRKLVLSIFQLRSNLGQDSTTLLQTWLTKYPEDSGTRTFLAMAYQKQKQTQKAQQAYEKVLTQNPKNPIALNNLAWIYLNQGEAEKALSFAERAYKVVPNRVDILDTLGWVQLHAGQVDRGIRSLKQALLKKPDHLTISYHYAVGLSKVNKTQAARKVLKKIIDTGKAFPEKTAAEQLLQKL